jgi:hypothetical protein
VCGTCRYFHGRDVSYTRYEVVENVTGCWPFRRRERSMYPTYVHAIIEQCRRFPKYADRGEVDTCGEWAVKGGQR